MLQICETPLYEPYFLSECGHSICFLCKERMSDACLFCGILVHTLSAFAADRKRLQSKLEMSIIRGSFCVFQVNANILGKFLTNLIYFNKTIISNIVKGTSL